MNKDFDSILKSAVTRQKQKELDAFMKTGGLPFRVKFQKKMQHTLQNPPRRIRMKKIAAASLAAVIALTFVGMALPELRGAFHDPLYITQLSALDYSRTTVHLSDGVLYQLEQDENNRTAIEAVNVNSEKTKNTPLPALDGRNFSWKAISRDEKSGEFTLLGYDDGYCYFTVSPDGGIIREISVDLLNEYCPPDYSTSVSLNGGKIVFWTRLTGEAVTNYHVYDPIDQLHWYLGDDITGLCTVNGSLYYLVTNYYKEYDSRSGEPYYPHTLYRFNEDGGAQTVIGKIAKHIFLIDECAMSYDERHNRLYYEESGSLVALDLATGEMSTALRMDSMNVSDSLIYALQIDSGMILYRTVTEGRVHNLPNNLFGFADEDTLTPIRFAAPVAISSEDSELYSEIFQKMWEENHNSYGVYSHAIGSGYGETMLQKLENGDTDFDIFYLDSGMPELFDSEYLEDLSKYSVLDGTYDAMLDGVEALCTVDGTTALIPTSLYTTMMRRDNSLSAEVFPIPDTLDQLKSLRNTAVPSLKNNAYYMTGSRAYVLMLPWFRQVSDNCIAGNLTADEARTALAALYNITGDFADDNTVWTDSGAALKKAYLLAVQNKGMESTVFAQGDITAAALPKVTDDCVNSFTGGYYAVNPNSPNKKEAAAFLAYYADYYRDAANGNLSAAQLYEGFDPTRIPDTSPSQYYNEPSPSTDGSEAAYALFCEQLKNSVRSYDPAGYSAHISDVLDQLRAGTINETQAADMTFAFIENLIK